MRAYRKRTQHPICVYLTNEEFIGLSSQLEAASLKDDWFPTIHALRLKLRALRDDSERNQA